MTNYLSRLIHIKSKVSSPCLKVRMMIFSFCIITSFGCISNNRAIFIGELPEGKTYTSTRFEFRYGQETRIVEDPYSQMQWIYGELPDSISVREGERLIIYNSPGAVIKSRNDSMDVQYDSLQHKGYMGIWTGGSHFEVNEEGVIKEVFLK